MAGRIRQSDVDEVKARTNIADIVGDHVSLKRAGVGSLKGLCPFHDERSPSFHVRPQVGLLPLLRLRRGRRRLHVPAADGPRLVHRGRRAARGAASASSCTTKTAARPPITATGRACSPPTRPPPSSSSSAARHARGRGRAGDSSASAASTPTRPKQLRRRLRPEELGRAHRPPQGPRLHDRRARGIRPRLAGRPRHLRPVPRAPRLADPRRHRPDRRLRRAASCSTTTRARSTSTRPRPPVYHKSPGALRARPRQARHRQGPAASSSSRATPTSWRATSRA